MIGLQFWIVREFGMNDIEVLLWPGGFTRWQQCYVSPNVQQFFLTCFSSSVMIECRSSPSSKRWRNFANFFWLAKSLIMTASLPGCCTCMNAQTKQRKLYQKSMSVFIKFYHCFALLDEVRYSNVGCRIFLVSMWILRTRIVHWYGPKITRLTLTATICRFFRSRPLWTCTRDGWND